MSAVFAVDIARCIDDVTTLVFHEPKLCLSINLFFRQATPLLWSAAVCNIVNSSSKSSEMCRLLLENAADVNARDNL